MRLTPQAHREVHELIWRLIDHTITREASDRLDSLLLESDEARSLYAHCLWLQSELTWNFSGHLGERAELNTARDRFLRQLPTL